MATKHNKTVQCNTLYQPKTVQQSNILKIKNERTLEIFDAKVQDNGWLTLFYKSNIKLVFYVESNDTQLFQIQ